MKTKTIIENEDDFDQDDIPMDTADELETDDLPAEDDLDVDEIGDEDADAERLNLKNVVTAMIDDNTDEANLEFHAYLKSKLKNSIRADAGSEEAE